MADQNPIYTPEQFSGLDLTAKLRAVAAASAEKIKDLDAQRQSAIEAEAIAQDNRYRNMDSWSKAVDAPTGSALGVASNGAAVFFNGVGRFIGHTGSLIPNKVSADMLAETPDAVLQAYNRFNKGQETQADRELLKAKSTVNINEINPPSNIERLFKIENTRGLGRRINDLFDFNSIVQKDNRDGLDKSLEAAKGDLTTLTDSKASIKDRAKALAGALGVAGSAAVDNKMAAAEYAVENLPQLLVGGAGVKGATLLAGSNIGYAMDEFSKGLENRAKEGKDIPLQEEQQSLLLKAGSLALAEQLGEMGQLAGMGKILGKAEAAAAKIGIKGALFNTLKAGAGGFAEEAVTEGYQSGMEAHIEGRKVTPMEIYKGAVIGGLSGGMLTGGGRVLSEITQSTPEHMEKRADKVAQSLAFKAAVEANDPSTFLDENNKHYNPALAVGVLHQANLSETATPESRRANFDKATELMSQMDKRSDELKETIKTGTEAEVKAARTELAKLVPRRNDGAAVWDSMYTELTKVTTPESVSEQVQQANTPAPAATAETQQATDSVINLSMASINHLTAAQAEELAGNTENGLNDDQRAFLRSFSAARIAYNDAQTIGSVSNTVMNGDADNIGISQYRTRIGMALTSGNQAKATADMTLLNNFATSHTEKAAVAQAAFEKYGDAGQVYKTDQGWGMAAPGTYTVKELRPNGGLVMIKPKLLKALQAESKALAATRDEMDHAIKLKFGVATPSQTVAAPVQSPAPAANIPPSPNLSVQDHAEDTPRLSVEPTDSTAETPRPPKEKVNHEGKKFATAKEADQYIHDNFLGNSYNIVRDADKKGVTIQPKKKSAPKTEEKKSVLSGNDKQAKIDALLAAAEANPNNGGAPRKLDVVEDAATPTTPVAPSPSPTPAASVANAPSLQEGAAALAENPETQTQQEVGEQQASAPAESAVAETTPAVEAIAETTPAGTKYQLKKLGDLFKQAPTLLGKVKDVISLVSTPEALAEQVGISGLTMEQGTALRSFMTNAKAWQAAITSNLVDVGTPEYNYRDAMQHFIREDGDIEENVKTAIAYAVFSYIAENFGGKGYNTKGAINAILGREKDTFINQQEHELFSEVTASMPAVIEALGQRITKALGLQETADTPVNELARLSAGLGAHALRLLTDGDKPLMTMKSVKLQTMNEIRARSKKGAAASVGVTNSNQDEVFLSVNRDAERVATPVAADIVKSVQGSKGIINELFAIESAERPPTFEPVKKLRAFAKRTEQAVPEFLNKILRNLNQQKNYLRQDKLEISQVLGDDRFLKAMGVTDVGTDVHVANRKSAEARNDGLRRELANLQEFVKSYLKDDLSTAFYFEHYAMKQQRVGIANSMINPQLSKIHRFMVYRNSWITTVDMADRVAMENFVLRAAEGLGVKTDKNDRAAALAEFKALFKSGAVQAGIDALNKINSGETLTDAEKDAIVTAVGDHAAHGLDALVALAAYDRAVNSKATTFKVNMLSEVDGVTNGPMLSHLLMGAAGSVADLFAMLNRGGFYQSAKTQFNDWRSTFGNQDLYETTTSNTLRTKDQMVLNGDIDERMLAPVMHFMGKLTDGTTGAVLKAGRNMIKTPLTAMVYGSGIKTAIEGMAGDFIANIYKQMESAYALRDTDSAAAIKMHKQTVAALTALGIKVPANTGVADIMELQFSKADEDLLIGQFMETLGKAVEATIRHDFKHLLDTRTRFNATASLTFDMYNAAYEGLRNQLIAELVKSGEIAATALNNELHDLTPKQEKILDERMAKITPVLQTAMSNLSGDANAHTGMLVSDTEMKPAKTLSYRNIVNFAKGFKGGNTKSLTVYARRLVNADPGVGLGATSTHSFDSAVAHTAIMEASRLGKEILNLHDAGGTGIDDLIAQGQRMNKAVWDRAISWSPTTEMYESFVRTIKGMEALIADKNTPKEVLELLAKSIVAQSNKFAGKDVNGEKKRQPHPSTLLMARALEAKRLAFETNSIKFEGMSQMYSIAQYAVEGGQYDVTDKNREEALARLNRETPDMLPQDIASVQAVNDALQDYIKAAIMDDKAAKAAKEKGPQKEIKTSDIGTLGKPTVDSDVKLVNFFRTKPNRSVAEVAAFLKTQGLNGFQDKLLSALVKSLGSRANSYSVNFLTKTSALKEVMELPKGPSHAWFVSKEGKNAIYLLSPDFKESGLTVETLLHEMTHAAVAHAIANPTAETRPLIDELEKLREKAAEVVYSMKMAHLAPAVESVQELVAYGMTNPEFQAVLDSFAHTTSNKDNKWVSGLWAFIDTLVNLVFGKTHEGVATGMTSLVTNVSGLMAASAAAPASNSNINQSMSAAAPVLASLRGEEMFDALATLGTTRLTPAFDAQLRSVLNQMEESVHSPLAALKAAALAVAAQTPVEMWDKVKTAGLVEFAKSALASGFNFTEQEAFALQQVEATVRTALHNKDGSTTAVYRELARLYGEVRENLKGRISEFHPNANQAQKLYDFVFKMEAQNGNQSDYLSRFAALGLANQEFASLLGFNTEVMAKPLSGMTFSEKLHAIFERALEWINAKATNTFGGQKADDKLQSLVNQLVDIEQAKRMKLSQSASVAMDAFEKVFRDGFEGARKGINAVATSDFFKNNTNGLIRFSGTVTSLVATDRVEQYLNALQKFRDETMRDRMGPMMGLIGETRGAHALNVMYHKLLRLTKHTESTRKEIINNTKNFVAESFKDAGEYLNEKAKKAVTYGILRTDVAALLDHNFDIKAIEKLFTSSAELNKAITNFETQLSVFTHAQSYKNGALALGLFLATNEAGAENLRLNADNIAAMLGTEHKGKVSQDDITSATPVIDALSTLYAIRSLDPVYANGVAVVFAVESARTDNGHGIDMLIRMHKDLQKQSKDRLFDGSGALRMKGYTPEVHNPYIRIEVANSKVRDIITGKTEGEKLEEHGYAPGSLLQMDTADPEANDNMRIYKLRDGGMVQYLTGIFSYTGQNKRGASTHNGDLGLLSAAGLMNRAKMDKIARGQLAGIRQQAATNIDPTTNAKKRNYLVPVFNANGDVVNYRYMMNAATRDGLLERTNEFDQLMGVMAGSIYDKEITATQNATAVQALYDQYKQDFAQNAGSYLQVGPNSPDKEAREVWRLLPESTRESVRAIWGTNAMMVRYDVLDMNFGYRKRSAATPFGIPEDERDNFQKAYVELLEGVMGKKAGLYVRRTEEIWQTLVREAKDTMVVKSGITLLGNFTSNITELIWFGVPLTDIWHHHRVALKGITAYRKDSKKLDALEQAVRLNSLQGRDRAEVAREIVQLKDALARNPVRELVEAGMMPTIVEDVSQEEDKHSYKGQLTGAIDSFVGNLNPHVLKAGKFMVMAHDTPLYKALSYGTQVSDFVARYTLYQHVLNRAKNPLQGEIALQMVSDAFVNYDVPSHRDIQYANDMGLVYFTKYYLRIQKVIALLYRENPGRAMMLLTLGHFMDFIPMLTHSTMLSRIGNPFSLGAFESLTSLDELLTIQTLMYPFR